MAPTLCETFRSLVFRTYDQIGRGRRLDHQLLEETITDINILELKDRHSQEIWTQTFNKNKEGKNGADWEWWLTNSKKECWLGLRVQAKILKIESNEFEHLHYRSGKEKKYQLSKLKEKSALGGLIPLYCFYTHDPAHSRGDALRYRRFIHSLESYGCALAPLKHIEMLQKKGEVRDFISVMRGAFPWHCLVCNSGFGDEDLPSRAWSFLQSSMGVALAEEEEELKDTPTVLRESAPPYVRAVVENRNPDNFPNDIYGVLIVQGRE